jgi:N-methylhydantoinase A
VTTPVFDGTALEPRNVVAGPALVEYPASTVAVAGGQEAVVDELLDLVIRRPA